MVAVTITAVYSIFKGIKLIEHCIKRKKKPLNLEN